MCWNWKAFKPYMYDGSLGQKVQAVAMANFNIHGWYTTT